MKNKRYYLISIIATGILILAAGCALLDLFSPVKFNTIIEGKIDFTDKYSEDSNDLIFYWDYYEVNLKSGKTYSLELWTDPGCPIHFECKQLGVDLGAWSDGNGTWDGYLKYNIPTSFTGTFKFDFYLRADHVGSSSWYRFRINEN